VSMMTVITRFHVEVQERGVCNVIYSEWKLSEKVVDEDVRGASERSGNMTQMR
jgi:hypothetical protein